MALYLPKDLDLRFVALGKIKLDRYIDIVSQALEIIRRASEIISRALNIISRVLEIICRALDIFLSEKKNMCLKCTTVFFYSKEKYI
jgi:hypothetical protein